MECDAKPSLSEAHPETMDFLSRAWCNFAVQALQPEPQEQSMVLMDSSINKLEHEATAPMAKMDKSMKMDDGDFKSLPPWNSNDLKSWIWMQQAMHPEMNYNSCFHKKWVPFKLVPLKGLSIRKWMKERKQKRKEEDRLQRAEVHAAVSVAGLAAALAAIASQKGEPCTAKEAAVASAAALVAAHCAKVAEAIGARKEQVSTAIGSAMSGRSTGDIVTLTAAATTSLKGAATLKARSGCNKKRLNASAPILPIEENHKADELGESTSLLAKGAALGVETPDGEYKLRWVSVTRDCGKVILKYKKFSLWHRAKRCTILDLHGELYRESEAESRENEETCYLIVLTTNLGTVKLDMVDDYQRYKTWAASIQHLLMLSSSLTNYQLQF